MKKTTKKILCLALTLALLAGLGVFAASAAGTVTLHTGGGVIVHSDWRVVYDYTYTGTANTLPTPQMAGATFEGWYTDIGLTGEYKAAGATADGGDYYAKWTPIETGDNGKMSYSLTSAGGTATGYKAGESLKAFFVNGGFYTAYSASPLPAPGGTGDYGGTALTGLNSGYVKLTGDTYLMRVMNLEGGFVRLSYYLTNRGGSDVSGLSLGAAADTQLGGSDAVPLRVVEDGGDTYLEMYDTTAGNMLRLYYRGDKVTDASRFWYGGYWGSDNKNADSFTANTFNDGKDGKYKDGMDSAFAFSWEDISLAPGETKKFSVLLGVGAPGAMEGGCTLSYDANGGAWTGGTPASRSHESGEIVTVTETEPTRAGYVFDGWGFSPAEKGAPYQFGSDNNRVAVLGDTVLYAQWTPTPYKATVNLKQDDTPLPGQEVTLVQYGLVRYKLEYDADVATKAYVTEPGTSTGGAVSGVYDVYVNGVDSLTDLTINNADGYAMVFYRSANVNLTKDGENDPWTGQSVALYERDGHNKLYTLEYNDVSDTYEKGLILPSTYDVYVSGARVAVMDISIPASDKATTTLPYYTASVDLTLDGKPWTAQSVTVGDVKAQYANGKYTAVVPNFGLDPDGIPNVAANPYAVKRGTETLRSVTATAKAITVNYYTVTFYDDASKIETKFIKTGEKVSADNPQKDGYSFKEWQSATGAAVTLPLEITAATKLYAMWTEPKVNPGESEKVGSDATKYKFPNLTITGYGHDYKVSSIKIEITSGGGSVSLASGSGYTAVSSNSNTTVTILFASPVSVSDAEDLLHYVEFTLGSTAQTVDFTVYAEHVTYS